jgi:hypothetical protein
MYTPASAIASCALVSRQLSLLEVKANVCYCTYYTRAKHYTDNGLQLYQWNGTQAGVFEKRQGQEIVNSIK